MRAIFAALLLAACQNGPAPVEDARLAFEHPQHGLSEGPDDWYLTRQDGSWGSAAQQSLWRLTEGADTPVRPDWVDADASESDFHFSERFSRACFVSTRPLPGAPGPADSNIWCMAWTGSEWGAPYALPSPVNSQAQVWSPVTAPDGRVYFASDREGGLGLGDLYVAEETTGGWVVSALPSAINSEGGEWNLDLSPDGRTLVFEASHRTTNRTAAGDLYVSKWTGGAWTPAEPLPELNTDGSDLMPRFIGDDEFVFTSVVDGKSAFRLGRVEE